MKQNKAYKYRIYPTEKQIEYFEGAFKAGRHVYNVSLDCEKQIYQLGGKSNLSHFGLNYHIKNYRVKAPFLNEYDANIYSYEMEALSKAYKNFFKNKVGYPKFKKESDTTQSFTTRPSTNQNVKNLYVTDDGYLKIPKVEKLIKIKYHRPIEGKIKTVTISKKHDKYYVSIMVEYTNNVKNVEVKKSVGIDLGVKTFVVTSDNEVIENPKHLTKNQEHLTVLQRKLSRAKKGSNNYKKIKKSISKIHEKVVNTRENFLHNESKKLVDNYDLICMEDLNVKGMTKSSKGTKENPGKNVKQKSGLNRNIIDVGFGKFKTMIGYKTKNSGKYLVEIGRFEPTSKKCNCCGTINKNLELKDRIWKCENCGETLNRDLNAALNIRDLGTKKFFDNLKK